MILPRPFLAALLGCLFLVLPLRGEWTKVIPSGRPSAPFLDLCYGNGEWIATGGRGMICRLGPSDRWVEIASPVGQNLNDIADLGDRFVAVGDGGVILLSVPGDMASWTLVTSGTGVNLRSVQRFGSDIFVLGQKGLVLHSTDGQSWTIRHPYDDNNPRFEALVKLGGELLGIVGRQVWRSADGGSWTRDTSADTRVDYVQNVRLLNGRLVAWGDFRGLSQSLDGRTWTTVPCPLTDSWDDVTDVIHTGGRYLLVGSDRFQEEERPIYSSVDLNTWTTTDGRAGRRIVAGNGKLVAIAATSHEMSAEGIYWRRPDSYLFRPVVFGGGQFRAAHRNFLYSSSDGLSWTESRLPAGVQADGLQFANGRYLTLSGNKISVSTDFQAWQTATLPVGDYLKYFQYSFGKYWACLPRAIYGAWPAVATSADGLAWSLLSVDATALAVSPDRIVAIRGMSGTWWSNVSINGTTFTQYAYSQPSPPLDIAYGNGLFVAISSDPGYECRTSTDGVTWTVRSAPSSLRSAKNISFAGGRFFARGQGGLILGSVDGVTWTDLSVPLWERFTVSVHSGTS
jgi:hypothetical protein